MASNLSKPGSRKFLSCVRCFVSSIPDPCSVRPLVSWCLLLVSRPSTTAYASYTMQELPVGSYALYLFMGYYIRKWVGIRQKILIFLL